MNPMLLQTGGRLVWPIFRRVLVKAIEREKNDGDANDGEMLEFVLFFLDAIFSYTTKKEGK